VFVFEAPAVRYALSTPPSLPLHVTLERPRLPVPYRDPAPKVSRPAKAELTYVPLERTDRGSGMTAAFQIVALPTVLFCVVWKTVGPTEGAVAWVIALALSVWMWRRTPKPGAVLRVEDGVLLVRPRGAKETLYRVRLLDLDDVVLQTKTVERVVDIATGNPYARTLNPQIAPKTDTNRIALEGRGEAEFALTDEYQSHSDTLDWFGKIRVFLRRNGWTPIDEREPPSGQVASGRGDAADDDG